MQAFGAFNNDLNIRLNSSSGGIFYALAYYVISKGGTCYGATIDKEGNVEHIRISDVEEIRLLMGSKYVRSQINPNLYRLIEDDLNSNKIILFVGTPCQVHTIANFLKIKKLDSDFVFLIQIFCHGTPDIKYWNIYREENHRNHLYSFRIKDPSWDKYSVNIGKKKQLYYKNPYMYLFLNNYILSRHCYKCQYKGVKDYFDLAIGDFWGIQNINPSYYSKAGISLIISTDSFKANTLISILKKSCTIFSASFDSAVSYNPAFNKPASIPTDLRAIQLLIVNNNSIEKSYKYVVKKKKINIFLRIMKKIGILK